MSFKLKPTVTYQSGSESTIYQHDFMTEFTFPTLLPLQAVVRFHSQPEGVNSKHEWALESSNISAVSNIAMQVFEYSHLCAKSEKTATLEISQYALLSPHRSLILLLYQPHKHMSNANMIELSNQDTEVHQRVRLATTRPRMRVADFTRRRLRVGAAS